MSRNDSSDLLISYIAAIGSMLVDDDPVRSDEAMAWIYTLHVVGKPWIVGALDEGVSVSVMVKSIGSLSRAILRPSAIIIHEKDATYSHLGNLLPYGELLRAVLSNFNALIIASEETASIFRRGPDPQPWIVDWNDPRGNPVKCAIDDGIISRENCEEKFKKYIHNMKHSPISEGKRKQFLMDASRACPLTIEKKIY